MRMQSLSRGSTTVFATLLVVAGGATTASPSYPLFSQCDAKWADDEMGVPGTGERATICKEGCAMSCVAMALAGHQIYINNSEVRVAGPGVVFLLDGATLRSHILPHCSLTATLARTHWQLLNCCCFTFSAAAILSDTVNYF